MSAEVKAKRQAMAKRFEMTQRAMSDTVDQVALMKRSAVPYASTWTGKSVSESGPIPTDHHLIPSNMVIMKSDPPMFKERATTGSVASISGKPWASFKKSEPAVFETNFAAADSSAAAAGGPPKPKYDEEMWRAQYQEWTLQKNAFNPDIAAAMRTNVRKMANLAVPTGAVDPARTSENVKMALQCSDVTGPAVPMGKSKLTAANALPFFHR